MLGEPGGLHGGGDRDEQLHSMLCQVLQSDGPPPAWFHRNSELGVGEVGALCAKPLVPLDAGTKGGCELFKTDDNSMIVKRMHDHEALTLDAMTFFQLYDSSDRSLLVPFYAFFELFGLHWGIMPNILLLEKESALYDLKGVTNPRYFKETPPFRDPNWIADFRHLSESGEECINAGVPVEAYLETIEGLAEDVDKLAGFGAVDYSLLTATYDESAVDHRSALGKRVWPMYDFKARSAKAVLLGGVIDYLEYVWTQRRARPESDFTRSFYLDAKAYSCRFFFFVATQMLAPCRDVEHGRGCVESFGPVLSDIFQGVTDGPVVDNFLVSGCRDFPKHHTSVRSVVPKIAAFVRESLA